MIIINWGKLDISTLEKWLWEAACSIRGEIDAPKYKNYIIPLIFYKRLCDVYEDEIRKLVEEFKRDETVVKEFKKRGIKIEEEIKELVKKDRNLVRFYIPDECLWNNVRKTTTGIGEKLTSALREIAKENPKLQGVIDIVDFNVTQAGQRIISDESIHQLMAILSKYRLGLDDVEPDILGRAYEYLLRKFAEGSGQSAGEFYTPREVGLLMAYLLDPEEGEEVYDPTCGSGGLLIKSQIVLREKKKEVERPLKLYGQEINPFTYAMAKMNAFIHDMDAHIEVGDTIKNPKFVEGDRVKRFDKVIANPMWNQKYPPEVFENDPYNRFTFGIPPSRQSSDWGWIQHMFASLKDGGKLAVVIDTGAVTRGSGSSGTDREKEIRKKFVENDLIEAVILLADNLFYNTTAPGNIIVINKNKRHKGEVLLINASKEFTKGRPKNYLTEENIKRILDAYFNWKEIEGFSKIITIEEVRKNDYNLSPSRYVSAEEREEVPPVENVLAELAKVEEERNKVDRELKEILGKLGWSYGDG
ncbi:MAG TPA: SAM-dependent DNA methyltransferase [Methanococcaceae archaeon]|uniref:site-specific DNA-methyltransferase (adenine-specific) n=1 Tax=Methanothermococcus okinawensis TaxID=155863 RepID=A0A832ZIL7_9EURY|nr:SAM-dependent DNA methyltransferase [Methanococcaceae archaeon]HIP90826.1 SAM-dependent DNA methyltransferase [Methanothermococcus okinawensis]